jgi:hypothetical protein
VGVLYQAVSVHTCAEDHGLLSVVEGVLAFVGHRSFGLSVMLVGRPAPRGRAGAAMAGGSLWSAFGSDTPPSF